MAALALVILLPAAANAQGKNPLAGGMWERYWQGEAGTPGAASTVPAFLTFTDDGFFFLVAAPADRRLPKPLTEMTREELVAHFSNVQIRRGRYTISGKGPYKLVLIDDVALLTTDGSCKPEDGCEIRSENGEVRLHNPARRVDTRWRRVPAAK